MNEDFEFSDLNSKGFFGDLFSGTNSRQTAATLTKYGIPIATLLSNNKRIRQLRDDSKLDLENVDLLTGVVRDMQRPNFGLPARQFAGSSLAENVAAQKFGDAQQRSNELNFEMQNALSKIQQENQILDRTNKNRIINNQINNNEKSYNAQIAARELLGNTLPMKDDTITSIFHNLQTDFSTGQYLDSVSSVSKASEIITNPDAYTEEEVAQAKAFMNSYGKRKTKFSR